MPISKRMIVTAVLKQFQQKPISKRMIDHMNTLAAQQTWQTYRRLQVLHDALGYSCSSDEDVIYLGKNEIKAKAKIDSFLKSEYRVRAGILIRKEGK